MERKRTYKSKSGAEYELVQTKPPSQKKRGGGGTKRKKEHTADVKRQARRAKSGSVRKGQKRSRAKGTWLHFAVR